MYAYTDKKPSGFYKLNQACGNMLQKYRACMHTCNYMQLSKSTLIYLHAIHATCKTQPSLMLHVLAYDWGMIFLVSYGGKYLVQRITTGQRMAESSVLDAHSDKVSYQRTFFPFLSLFCLIIRPESYGS